METHELAPVAYLNSESLFGPSDGLLGLHLATVDGDITQQHAEALQADRAPEETTLERPALYIVPPLPDQEQTSKITEVYGKSLGVMRAAGRVAFRAMRMGIEFIKTPEVKRLRDEFDTSIGEMLKTAPGIGEFITIERDDSHNVRDGLILTEDKKPVQDLIENGAKCSYELSKTEAPYAIQSKRDYADLKLLKESVQPMWQGASYNTVVAVSAWPEDGVLRHGRAFWKSRGYNDKHECAMLQMYHKVDDSTVQTRVLSIDSSNVERLADMLRSRGGEVPEDVSATDLITHALKLKMTYQEACTFMDDFVAQAEAKAGLLPKVTTTKKIMAEQSALTDRAFETMYLPTAVSLDQGQKSPELQVFINAIQPATKNMDQSSRAAIQRLAQRQDFVDEDVRTMHGAVLYSVAVVMRQAIVNKLELRHSTDAPTAVDLQPQIHIPLHSADFLEQMGGGFSNGVAQGIVVGGCGAEFGYGRVSNEQDVFGGKHNKGDSDSDSMGSLTFSCTRGHRNRRPRNGFLMECPKCPKSDGGRSVRCDVPPKVKPTPKVKRTSFWPSMKS